MTTPPKKKPDYLRLSCAVQRYAWGKVGLDSEVARLKVASEPDQFVVEENQTYAELWMGTHAKGPSKISHPKDLEGLLLSDWLESNQWALGDTVAEKFHGKLPFLLKVLSINMALSIQAHPSKSHAEALHASAPELYRDPNHKPELAVAISNFEGFCGFRPFDEIMGFVSAVPELEDLVTRGGCNAMISKNGSLDRQKDALKSIFTGLMNCEKKVVKEKVSELVKRVSDGKSGIPEQESSLILRLNNQFPGDIGCFSVFFLNFLHLKPGEALYLAPNEPHAYLYGEVVECMACSDNVVRAGLTIKYKDKDTLCQMLTYSTKLPAENKFLPQSHPTMANTEVYDPPTPEFAVARITITKGSEEFLLPSMKGPSILIVLDGSALMSCGSSHNEPISKGVTLFVPATSPDVRLLTQTDLLLFRAFCDL